MRRRFTGDSRTPVCCSSTMCNSCRAAVRCRPSCCACARSSGRTAARSCAPATGPRATSRTPRAGWCTTCRAAWWWTSDLRRFSRRTGIRRGRAERALRRRALRGDSDPGSAALIATYERCVGRLRTLQCEAASIDADLASMDIFRDPARVAAAEDLVARARQHKTAAEEQARAESIDAPDTFEIIDVIEPVETDDVAPVEADDYQAEADYVEPEADEAPPVSVIARRTSRGMVITSIVADDPFFLDEEKVVWEWPDALGRVIEEF